MRNQSKAYILTVLVIIFWATAASAFKIALSYVTPYTLLFYSTLFSTISLFIILTIQGKLDLLKKINRKTLGKAALLGFLNPFLYYVVLFKAYAILPGQIAMSLNYGWPLVLTLLSVPILGQQLSRSQLLAVLISFIGAVIIATRGEFTSFGGVSQLGVLLAAGSTLIWATYWLFNAKDGLDPVLKLFTGFCFGFLFTTLFGLATKGISLPPALAWLPLIYVSLFEMSITFALWLTALQLTSSAARISNLIYVTPFFSLLILHLVIGEKIYPATFVGLLLIVGSILFQGWLGRKKVRDKR
ncbi:MAG: DMT family transporter [Thermodesulfobacteriota bacterium]|nr:DMT family transporter [Thermodesulfobacteriota bacterium]